MRVGLLHSLQTTITLETWIGASRVTMPPGAGTPPVWVGRWCFFIMFTPSTMTRVFFGMHLADHARLAPVLAGDHEHGVVASDT